MSAERGSSTVPGTKRRCPICSKPTVQAFRPFCSKRCADIDLHRWLGGQYAVPVIEEDGGEAGEESAEDRPPPN